MSRRGALLLAALSVSILALVTLRQGAAPAPAPARGARGMSAEARQAGPEIDPASIRDVFRFVDAPPVAPRPRDPDPAPAVTGSVPVPDPVRLVGLVRRQGRLLAAFAVDGDVVLAGPGETVGGVTVLEVGEDAVRVRRRDGVEQRLALP